MGSKSWVRGLPPVATGARVWNILAAPSAWTSVSTVPAVPSCNHGPKSSCETLTLITNPLQMHIPSWLWFRMGVNHRVDCHNEVPRESTTMSDKGNYRAW